MGKRILKVALTVAMLFSLALSLVNLIFFTTKVEYITYETKDSWLSIAKTAWRYFTPGIGVSPYTGLNYGSLGWRVITDWDLGSYIVAILRAEELGLVRPEGEWGSENRLNKVLDFLLSRENTPKGIPYHSYYSDTGKPFDNRSTNPSDSGRLLIALKMLIERKPHFSDKVSYYLSRTNYTYIAVNNAAWKFSDIYRYLDAVGFKLWGFDKFEPVKRVLEEFKKLETYPKVSVYGIEMPQIGLTSEPLILGYFDLNLSELKKYLDLSYEIQKRRYWSTGIITAWSEGGINEEPYYIYQWIVTQSGRTWVTSVQKTPVAFTKIALSFAAIYDDYYSDLLFKSFTGNFVKEGFLEGISEAGEPTFVGITPYVTDKTNSMIISAAYYAINKLDSEEQEALISPHYKVLKQKEITVMYLHFNDSQCECTTSIGNGFDGVVIPLLEGSPEGKVLRWITLTYESNSSASFNYSVYLVDEGRLFHKGPTFISHKEFIADEYRLDLPGQTVNRPDISNCIFKYVGNYAFPLLLVVKDAEQDGDFLRFNVLGLELVYDTPVKRVPYSLQSLYILMLLFYIVYVVLPLFIVCIIIMNINTLSLSRKLLLYSLFVSLSIRLSAAPFYAHPYDMEVWRYAARTFFELNLIGLNFTPSPISYYASLIGYAPYHILKMAGIEDKTYLHQTVFCLEMLFLKIPFIISDFIMAYVLYRILRFCFNQNISTSYSAMLIMLFNPLALGLSSYWGLYESLCLSFFLLGFYFLLRQRYLFSSIFFGLASATKFYGFLGLLMILIYLARLRKYTIMPLTITGHIATFLIAYIPLASWNVLKVIEHITGTVGLLGRLGLASSTNFIPSTSYLMLLQVVGLKPPTSILYLILATSVVFFMIVFAKKLYAGFELSESAIPFIILVFSMFYLFFFRTYPQYYLWIIPFLIILSISSHRISYSILAIYLSGFITLFIVNGMTLISGEEHYIVLTTLLKDATAFNSSVSTFILLIVIALLKNRSPLLLDPRKFSLAILLSVSLTIGIAYLILQTFL